MITTVAHNNEHAINFDEPILQPSRDRLTREGCKTGINIPPGHYTLESMAKKLTKLFNQNDIDLSIETNTSRREMVILNRKKYTIWLDLKLHELFDIEKETVPDVVVKRFKSPSSLFIHCDVV